MTGHRRILVTLAAVTAVVGCNRHPLTPLDEVVDAVRVEQVTQLGTNKIDVLFVIANSTSMDEEQIVLQDALPDFVAGLIEIGADFQLGVITPDMYSPTEQGRLRRLPGNSIEPGVRAVVAGVEQLDGDDNPLPCDDDATCVAEFGAGSWCEPFDTDVDPDDGTCFRREQVPCTIAADCGSSGDPARPYSCQDNFCWQELLFCQDSPGRLDYCEARSIVASEAYVDASGELSEEAAGRLVDDFLCITAPGTCSLGEIFERERAFDATVAALDPNNPLNAGFIRDDALLLVVFMSDDDDCSVGVGEDGRDNGFACWGENADPLYGIDQFYTFLTRTVKSADNQVLAAAIVGPAPLNFVYNGPQVACSASGDEGLLRGVAYPGDRYSRLVRRFGTRGVVGSICDTNFDPLLRSVTRSIQRNVGLNCISDVPKTCNSDRDCADGLTCVQAAPPFAAVSFFDEDGNELNRTCTVDADCFDEEGTEDRICDNARCLEPNLPAGTAPRFFCEDFNLTIRVRPNETVDYVDLTPPGAVNADRLDPNRDFEVDYYAFEQCGSTGAGFRFVTSQPPEAQVQVIYPISVSAQSRD